MTTEISLNTICGHTTKIIATKEGKNTHIHIKTTCDKLRKWGTHFDMGIKDLMGVPKPYLARKWLKHPLHLPVLSRQQ
jgi:pyruvate carboxylase